MKKLAFASLSVMAITVLQSCDSSDNSLAVVSDRPTQSRPASSVEVDVFQDFIAAARDAASVSPVGASNLFSNSDFENGVTDWSACLPGAIGTSSDAYQGSTALSLEAGNCFYRTLQVIPNESYELGCQIKLTNPRAWTGMGLEFSDANYNALTQAPVAVATASEYMQLNTAADAPDGAAFVSMWIHSDHGALVDNCSLSLPSQAPAVTSNASNLLENASFTELDADGHAADWTRGCGGSVVANNGGLFIADGACVDQALGADEAPLISANTATYECLVTEVDGYADISLFLNGELQAFTVIEPEDKNQRVSLTVEARSTQNGFVSLYSEGHLQVEECSLTVAGSSTTSNGSTTEPADTTTPDTGDTTDTTDTGDTESTSGNTVDSGENETTETATTPEPTTPQEPATVTETSARYRLTFDATWSAQTHPVNFPPPAHFSGLVGAVHNNDISFWGPGQLATEGVQEVAETGMTSLFLDEVADQVANGTVATEIAGDSVPVSPGSVSIEFEVTVDHPLVTVLSMVAPSPDWFVGVHDLNLFDGSQFVDSFTTEVRVYDAGTDSGVSFFSADSATQPAALIDLLSSDSADSDFINGIPTVGQFVIEKL